VLIDSPAGGGPKCGGTGVVTAERFVTGFVARLRAEAEYFPAIGATAKP
jgi:hypothetical protein